MADKNQTPEQIARDKIDALLEEAGWIVQSAKKVDFHAGLGIAIREYTTNVGPADYVLFADRKAVGIVEAKPEDWGHIITTVEEQSAGYASANLKWVRNSEPFLLSMKAQVLSPALLMGVIPIPGQERFLIFPVHKHYMNGTEIKSRYAVYYKICRR